jgi:hypothetical protein
MLRRVLIGLFLFGLIAAVLTSSVEAGIVVTIDIGNDGDNEFTSPAILAGLDPSPSNFVIPFAGVTEDDFVDGLALTGTVITTEDATGSMISEIHIESGTGTTAHTTVKITTTWTLVDDPPGSPLLLVSSMSTAIGLSSTIPSTHLSFLNGLPAGGLLASVTGPLDDSDSDIEEIDPVVHPMTISAETILNFSSGAVAFNADAATTVVAPVPEASTIAAWSFCAALGLLVAYRRKRAA